MDCVPSTKETYLLYFVYYERDACRAAEGKIGAAPSKLLKKWIIGTYVNYIRCSTIRLKLVISYFNPL